MIKPVRLARKEPISQYSSVNGSWLDGYWGVCAAWFMTRIGCWLLYGPECWLFSCVACTDIDRQSDMTHANTMFLRHDFIIYFHVFEFIQSPVVNIHQNNIGSIEAGQKKEGLETTQNLPLPTFACRSRIAATVAVHAQTVLHREYCIFRCLMQY